jgi:hypothetical protein
MTLACDMVISLAPGAGRKKTAAPQALHALRDVGLHEHAIPNLTAAQLLLGA